MEDQRDSQLSIWLSDARSFQSRRGSVRWTDPRQPRGRATVYSSAESTRAWRAPISAELPRRRTPPARFSSACGWYSDGMRWLVLLAALSLIAQDDEELLARHAASAAAAMKTGDYVAAEKHNREVVRLRPQLAEAEVNLGLSLFLQKKYAEAIRVFESSVKRKPELENAWLFLGISRFNL